MKLLLIVLVALSPLAACSSSSNGDNSAPAPATVKADTTGFTVDTTTP